MDAVAVGQKVKWLRTVRITHPVRDMGWISCGIGSCCRCWSFFLAAGCVCCTNLQGTCRRVAEGVDGMAEPGLADRVLVQVVPVEADREIGWGSSQVEAFRDRLSDVR